MWRSRKLLLTDWTKANNALNQYFEGNKSKLAESYGMSRTTVTAFFKQEAISEAAFRKLCLALRLNWEKVSSVQGAVPSRSDRSSTLIQDEDTSLQQIEVLIFWSMLELYVQELEFQIEALIQQIQEHCKQKILSQYSRMRLLSGEEIRVDQLYVDVWLLNRSPRTFQVSYSKLLEAFDLRNDRLGLGDRIKRNPGFEVAHAYAKLLILGKPGSGKTTFLKHLAVDWCKGEFYSDLIVALVEFRRIQDAKWNLLDAIRRELGLEEQQWIETLLELGKLLILMDGLDEVPTIKLRRDVQAQIRQIAENYPKNRLILTCRTQIMEVIPVGFTSVEVADFNAEQVEKFVQNWLIASGKSSVEALQEWKAFDEAVSKNLALKELTVTPVLLSLMCLVFQDEGEMPSRVDWLYEKGIKLLLSKWNKAKAIDGWEVGTQTYRQLSVEQKEALLTEIAARKFENPENFVLFQQEEISSHITQSLRLANYSKGVAVLKAIEAQHGLLIERADELWSFSHLTFQEYFTIRWLTQLSPEQLAEKITSQQWQNVVKQLVKSQQPADRLLRLIKQAIDHLLAREQTLQKFLTWVLQKSQSIQANQSAAIRAFHLFLTHDQAHDLALDLTRVRALDLARALTLARDRDHALILVHDLAHGLGHNFALVHRLIRALDRALALDRAHSLALAHDLTCGPKLRNRLEQLRAELPLLSLENWESFQQWWQANGTQWLEQLRQVMIEHRNIGHDWQFTDDQKQQLQRYYNANKFLVALLKIEGAVSDSVRSEIEDTLLLPWDELQRRR